MTVYLLLIAAYLYLSLVVAVLGRRTRLGFVRSLLLSIVITPLAAMLLLFLVFEARISPGRGAPARRAGVASRRGPV